MGNAIDPIKIKGLVEFQRALKEIEDGAQKQLRVVFNAVAETVAGGARRRVPSKTGKARGSVKVASSQREAIVKAGGARVSYYPWLDFGGRVGIHKSVSRPFVQTGRYLYPSYDASRAGIGQAVEEGLVDLVRSSGLEVD
jgi:hypothetical protein